MIVYVGWFLNIPVLTIFLPHLGVMKPDTAVGFMLASIALWRSTATPRHRRWPEFLCALMVVSLGLLTLGEYLFGWHPGIDPLLLLRTSLAPVEKLPIQMALATAVGFILLGPALALLTISSAPRLTQALAAAAIGNGIIALVGYLFGLSDQLPNPMSLHSAMLFCVAGGGVMLASVQAGFIGELNRGSIGGLVARRLVPAVIIVPLVIGWLRWQGELLGYYDTAQGVAIFVIGSIILMTLIVWWTARLVNRFETEREQARYKIERYAQRMELLHNIDQGILEAGSVEDLVDVSLTHLRRIIQCQRAYVGLFNETLTESTVYAADIDGRVTPPRGTLISLTPNYLQSFDARRLKVVHDIRPLQSSLQALQRPIAEGMRSWVSVLLMDGEHPMGTLSLFSSEIAFFGADYQEIVAEVGQQLAVALRQMRLSNALAEHTRDLEVAQKALQVANDMLEDRVRQRTAELQSIKDRVEAILNNSSDGIILMDLNLRIRQANAAFCRLVGYRRDEDISRTLLDYACSDDVENIRSIMQLAPEASRPRIEVRLRRPDGSLADIELGLGHIAGDGLVATVHDITERIAQERQLRYYASLQETVADAVIATDLDYKIQSWNRAAERIYGWRAEEVIGRSAVEVLHSDFSSGQTREAMQQQFLQNDVWTGEVAQRRKDGRTVDILSSAVLFKNERGEPFGIVVVNHDITLRKEAEDALRQSLKRERELGDLKTRFVTTASHEFRTPLAVILATAETLKNYRQQMTSDQQDDRLDKIARQVHHMTEIVETVLLQSRMQTNEAEFDTVKGDLDGLCRDVVNEFNKRPADRGRTIYNGTDSPLVLAYDPALMRHVISSLISNALKYSAAEKPVEVSLTQDASTAILRVLDTGIGIPEGDLPHLFEPFHRASNVGAISGTGLGLAITRNAVEMHGGTIKVDSELGRGTTFTVTIPIAPAVRPVVAA